MKKSLPVFIGLIISILMAFVMSSCGSSRKTVVVEEGWEKLGEAKVNFVRDRDEIDVTSDNKYTAIVFMVQDRDVRLNDLKIQFTNGDKLEPQMDDVITADSYSKVIEIDRDGRLIDNISFKYRTTGNVLKGRANVLVMGRRQQPFSARY